MITFKFTMCNEEGDEDDYTLPGQYIICHNCQGKGTHVNRAIDGNGISPEEFAEDPDFFDEYMAGTYDVSCENKCDNGKIIVPIDADNMSDEQKKLLLLLEAHEMDEHLYRQECEWERKMGA